MLGPVTVRLSKLHATGNDFLVWPNLEPAPSGAAVVPSAALARALCDRHTGIGADGLIVLGVGHRGADATMTLHNADGAIAEMSGNGIRCLAWVAVHHGVGDERLVVDTGAGRRTVELDRGSDGALVAATVDMGPVTFDPAEIPLDAPTPFDLTVAHHGTEYRGDAAGMGNPHLVLFVDDVAGARVTQHGPHLERDSRFPRRTNVEFIEREAVDTLRMRVWERGVGETRSCGTGACAAAAVAHRRDLVGARVDVRVPGGDLRVEIGDTIRLGGSVEHVFDVDIDPTGFVVEAP